MTVLLVMLGGAVGATLRYLIDTQVRSRQRSRFPWSTLMVNLLGSVVLGVLTGLTLPAAAESATHAALGVGLCGALTTFSTYSAEAVTLLARAQYAWAALHMSLHFVGSLAMTVAGIVILRLLTR